MSCNRCVCEKSVRTACILCFTFICLCAPISSSAQSLEQTYKAELTRLKADQSVLKNALKESEKVSQKARSLVTSEIESLARELTRLRADNAQNETQLPQAERMRSLQEQENSVELRQEQIKAWLNLHQVPMPVPAQQVNEDGVETAPQPALDAMVTAALQHVEQRGKLRVESEQEYFRLDGTATAGSILHVAEVGAGTVGQTFQPLIMGPDGSFRVTESISNPVTHGISRSLGFVLFDPTKVSSPRSQEAGILGWMNRGGLIMWAIAALALLALLLSLERTFALTRYYFRVRAAERLGPTAPVEANEMLMRPVAVVQAGKGNHEELETEAVEAILQIQPMIRRGVSLLAVVASVAPLLGLLGTVTGMIGTFAVITQHGTGDPRLLSGGISEALLTTQFGLMVAVPALLLQTTLYRSGDAILRRVEKFTLAALHSRNLDAPGDPLLIRSE